MNGGGTKCGIVRIGKCRMTVSSPSKRLSSAIDAIVIDPPVLPDGMVSVPSKEYSQYRFLKRCQRRHNQQSNTCHGAMSD